MYNKIIKWFPLGEFPNNEKDAKYPNRKWHYPAGTIC